MSAEFGDQLTGRGRDIHDPKVLAAMAAVPRAEFVPEELQRFAYEDGPLAIGERQTISQPFIVALMTQALRLEGGEKVLEVGTGSGYQAAVLAELGCEVFSVERIESLHRRAAEVLRKLGYSNVRLRLGDGAAGWEEESPFDAIIATCAAADVPEPLLEQLADGGRMVIPIGGRNETQELYLYAKGDKGSLTRQKLSDVRFVPLV